MTKQQFIQKYYPIAVSSTKGTGLFADTLITQLILESGYNLSALARNYNNFFGIKSGSSWTGKVVSMTTKEYRSDGSSYMIQGTGKVYNNRIEATTKGANAGSLFRVYSSVNDAFKGWVKFLQSLSRYRKVFLANTPEKQFIELQNAGYATSPTYAAQLTNLYNGLKNTIASVKPLSNDNNMASVSTIILIGLILASLRGIV